MTVKKTNLLLLISTLISMLFLIDPLKLDLSNKAGIGIEKLIQYSIITIIGIIMLKKNNENVFDFLPYNVKPKLKTMLWVVAIFVLIYPINALMSGIGGEFLGDVVSLVSQASADMVAEKETSVFMQLFNSAIIPAVFEEIFYRGFFYQGYKKNKGIRTAIILTSLLFGSFHMVPQQFLYTVPAGFVLALLRELTGSMWPGTFLHFLNNGFGVFDDIVWNAAPWLNHFDFKNKTNTIITAVSAVVCAVLIILVLRRISQIEGREEDFKTFFKEDRDRSSEEKIVTAPLVITLIIEGIMMIVASSVAAIISHFGIQ